MNVVEFIRLSLHGSKRWVEALARDMEDAPLTTPTAEGGNHPLWVVGHLAHSESAIVSKFIQGDKNPLARWDALFGMRSEPVADPSKYPSLDELLGEFEKVRARTLQVLASFTEADLDRPTGVDPSMQDLFGTVGRCFSALIVHTGFHTGQVADARRAAGRKPVRW